MQNEKHIYSDLIYGNGLTLIIGSWLKCRAGSPRARGDCIKSNLSRVIDGREVAVRLRQLCLGFHGNP